MPSAILYLRLVDVADGYIWQKPLRAYQSVTLTPLPHFAPDAAALAEVCRFPPRRHS
ncbi:MAG: hypothetical protein L0170_03145 [Acidobacteria bacterium]|nr:hypothetical protein [Acidobacteriota bacterium]